MLPTSAASWYPGDASRILFVAGDGALYHLELNDPDEVHDSSHSAPKRPQRLIWSTRPPGLGDVFLVDQVWPGHPKLGGRLLVSMSVVERVKGSLLYGPARLWWLKLDASGTEIEAAGPLLVNDDEHREGGSDIERCPTLGTTPEGTLSIAYVSRSEGDSRWRLHVAPLEIDKRSGAPQARRAASRCMADDCAPTMPAFSADGRWIACLVHNQSDKVVGPVRILVDKE
jgi:hypothetical protein